MAIGGAFLGGGVELVPAGSCKLELEAYTDNATVSATFTISGGGNTYTVTSGTDGRASKVVPSGITYTVSAAVTGYTAPPPQTVIAESSSIKYVRFDAQLKKAQGDISTLQTNVQTAQDDISSLKTDAGKAKSDISTLQADVKRAQSTADGKVSKSGGTMTGTLTIQQDGWNNLTFKHTKYDVLNPTEGDERTLNICAYDVNTHLTTSLTTSNNTNYVRTYLASYGYRLDGTRVTSSINIYANRDGTAYASAPSWSLGTNDNSDKILTIKMANSLPSLVHTTGNEDISGHKRFLNNITLKNNSDRALTFMKEDGTEVGYLSMNSSGDMWIKSSTGKVTLESPNGTVNAPATPNGATGNEIATAGWVRDRIKYGTGEPSGGEAGDIYIKY